MLEDSFGRRIKYLRISITNSCNLNCFYCTPHDNGCAHSRESLIADEIVRIAEIAATQGISKIRLTGGEPLLRSGLIEIVRRLKAIQGITDLSLTTNGVLLEHMAQPLASAGLSRVNISLDSLSHNTFFRITRGGALEKTLRGIRAARKAGLTPIKINMVLLKGINEHEIPHFAGMTLAEDIHIRFIEFMPITGDKPTWMQYYLPLENAISYCRNVAPLHEEESPSDGGPANYYTFPGARGKIGFIAPFSRHFCGDCNRLRITVDGKIRPCLFNREEINIRPLLNSKKEVLLTAFAQALASKPNPTQLDDNPLLRCRPRALGMLSIGG